MPPPAALVQFVPSEVRTFPFVQGTAYVSVERTILLPSPTRIFLEVAAPTLIPFPSVPARVRELLTVNAFPLVITIPLYVAFHEAAVVHEARIQVTSA